MNDANRACTPDLAMRVVVGLVSTLVGAAALFVAWYVYDLEHEAIVIGLAVAGSLYVATTAIYWLLAVLLGWPRWRSKELEDAPRWMMEALLRLLPLC